MSARSAFGALGVAAVLAVAGSAAGAPASGLTGTVWRGPTTPVCMVGKPCSAPMKTTLVFARHGQRFLFRSKPNGSYRALLPPLLKYVDAIDQGDRRRPIIVVLAEFVPRRWWEALLHNQTALLLKLRLFVRRNTSVLDVPYHLDDPEPLEIDDDQRPL